MSRFDYPGISVEEKSNEANMQTVKGYLIEMADALNYCIGRLEGKIEALENRVEELEGKDV